MDTETNDQKMTFSGILKTNHTYALYQVANLLSRFGDSLDAIAFSLLVYDITKSALSMSLFFLVNVLPNLLFFMPAGILADRKSNKKIILIGYIGRGACRNPAVSPVCYQNTYAVDDLCRDFHKLYVRSILDTLPKRHYSQNTG